MEGALRISIIYLLVAILWVLITDGILHRQAGPLPDTAETVWWLATAKRLLFVVVTALLLYLYLRRVRKREIAAFEAVRLRTTDIQAHLAKISGSVNDVVWSRDLRSGALLFLNEAVERLYGYPPQAFYDQPELWFTIIHEDDQARVRQHIGRLSETGKLEHEYRVRNRSGQVRYIFDRMFLVNDESGQPEVVNGVATDITVLRHAEEQIEAYKKQVADILESITDGFFAVDKDWNFTYVNRAFEHLLQRRREDLLGQNVWAHFPEAVGLKFYTEYHRALRDQVSVQFEEFFYPLGVWFQVTAYPTSEGLAAYFTDITERRRFEERILAQNEKLRDIAWMQSHEVRAPVANIIGLTSLMQSTFPPEAEVQEILRHLATASRELDQVIRRIVETTYEVEDVERLPK